jgi:hypothetical protein
MNAIGGEAVILELILKHLEENIPDSRRIYRHKKSTILRYIRTLFLLPAFDMERPIDLDSYGQRTLGALTSPDGRHVRYKATDRFLRDLTVLEVGEDISIALLSCYFKTFYSVGEMPVYIDGHFKAVWTLKNIPRGKHGMMDRVMPGLEQVFLNGQMGHPLLHRTCPGDRHLTKELLGIVKDFEKTVGDEVVNVVVFDGEGCSLEVFKAFDVLNEKREKEIYSLTVLDSNQYRFEDFKIKDEIDDGQRPVREQDFDVYKRDKKGRVRSRVALVEFDYLSNINRRRKDKDEYLARCALVKKKNDKLTVIVTTMPMDKIDSGAELADLYYNRWPCQEAKFKEMTKYCNLNVNHGFGKIEVFNRMAAKRLEDTETSLAYNVRRLENLKEKYEDVEKQMEKRSVQNEKNKEGVKGQIGKIKERLRDGKGDENKLRVRLEKKIVELGQLDGKYQGTIIVLRGRENVLNKKEKQILESIEQNKMKVDRWKKEVEDTSFYEIDSETDHIMTNFKILYENSLLYAKDVFFEEGTGMGMFVKQFVNHYGDLDILDGGKMFRFKLNKFDGKGLTKRAQRACEIFNDLEIRTADGVLLELVVKR